MPSVQYADMLAVTLPPWRRAFPRAEIVVPTTSSDRETVRVATEVGVTVLVTDAWTRHGAKFNKAAALDDAFGFVASRHALRAPRAGELCLAIDADIYPCGYLKPKTIAPDTLYGCARYSCDSMPELEAHASGETRRRDLRLIAPRRRDGLDLPPANTPAEVRRAARRCLGFFQLFRYRAGIRFGSAPTAGGYDLTFRDQFAQRDAVLSFYALHLGVRDRRNWSGRVVAQWATA